MANETPSRPPPLMANAIKNFHFDFLHPSLTINERIWTIASKYVILDMTPLQYS